MPCSIACARDPISFKLSPSCCPAETIDLLCDAGVSPAFPFFRSEGETPSSPMKDCLAQLDHQVRLDWGRAGVRRAAERRDIIVVVDVLRFTTTVVTALHHGVSIYPCDW